MALRRDDLTEMRRARQTLSESRAIASADMPIHADRQASRPQHIPRGYQAELFPAIGDAAELASVFYEGLSIELWAARALAQESSIQPTGKRENLIDAAGKHGARASDLALRAATAGFYRPTPLTADRIAVEYTLATVEVVDNAAVNPNKE